jgi:hypothetical protein
MCCKVPISAQALVIALQPRVQSHPFSRLLLASGSRRVELFGDTVSIFMRRPSNSTPRSYHCRIGARLAIRCLPEISITPKEVVVEPMRLIKPDLSFTVNRNPDRKRHVDARRGCFLV